MDLSALRMVELEKKERKHGASKRNCDEVGGIIVKVGVAIVKGDALGLFK